MHCCASKSDPLYTEHRNAHLINFLHGSVQILAAATISRAVSQFLFACIGNGDISDQIVAYFIYSICIAHILGYLVAIYLKNYKLFEYYFGLATDNASFAWNSTLTLAIINWLYAEKKVGIAIVAWICLLFLVFCVIYASNYVQDKIILPSKETKYIMRNFESEAFALAIAYSFTVIIAASIYRNESTNYLSNTDDVAALTDDSQYNLDWLFFAYVVVITLVLLAVQRFYDKKQDKRLSRYRTSVEAQVGSKNLIISADSDSSKSGKLGGPPTTVRERIRAWVFAWDDDKSTIASFRCLMKTSLGYLVGCGWQVWSVLSFQAYFKGAHGAVVATFIFALVMTVVVVTLLTRISVKEELKVRESLAERPSIQGDSSVLAEVAEEKHGITGRGDLWFIFGRLSVGWAWQTFITAATAAIVRHGAVDRVWLLALIDVANAVVVCTICGYVVMYFEKKPSSAEDGQQKNSSDSAEGKSSLETPLL